MVLQEDGPISLEDVQNEFGGDDPINFNEYYPNAYTGYSGHENDLLGWYKFDGNLNDSSGNNQHISSTITTSTSDFVKGSRSLYGTSTSATGNVGTIDLSNRSFTITVWMKLNSLDRYFFSQGTGVLTNKSLIMGIRATSGLYTLVFYNNDLNSTGSYTSDLNKWVHLAFIVEKNSSGLSDRYIYRNGILIGSDFNRANFTGSGTLRINGYTTTRGFTGYMDDFRVYNRALSQTEINQVIGYTTPLLHSYSGYVGHENDLLGWYKFDGNLNDSSGNNQHISSTITTSTNDYVKGTASLYNTSTSATGNVGNISLSSKSFTITAWMNNNNVSNRYPFHQGTSYSTNKRMHLGMRTDSKYALDFYASGMSTTTTYPGDVNKWVHIAFAVNKTGTLCDLYIYRNGALIQSKINNALFTGAGTFQINGYNSSTGFTGYMDDLRIYNKALSQTEVQHVMKNSQFLMEENTDPIDLSSLYNTGMKFNISPDIITQQKSGLDLKSFYVFNYNASYVTSGYTEYTVILSAMTSCEILMVGGGGSGGRSQSANRGGGGGGAGGLLYISKINLTPGEYTIRVGNGGSGSSSGVNGINTTITGPISYTAYGGGGGGNTGTSSTGGDAGGSGGGGADYNGAGGNRTQVGLYSHGNPGGKAVQASGWTAGGSGAGGGGSQSEGNAANSYAIGTGGSGKSFSITGSSIEYAKGGDGGRYNAGTGANGTNGRGNGGNGAGRYGTQKGGNGGSGVVVIKLLGRDFASTFESPTINTNGLEFFIDTMSSSSYSGSGSTIYNLLNSAETATLGGTYSLDTSLSGVRGIRLFNTSGSRTSNVSRVNVNKTINITTVSIWLYIHSFPSGTQYILDSRTGMSTGYIYNGSPGGNWATGKLYVNGGSQQSILWSNMNTTGVWRNITLVANNPGFDSITLFSRYSNNEGLNVTFGPIMIYNRELSEEENRQNYNYYCEVFGLSKA